MELWKTSLKNFFVVGDSGTGKTESALRRLLVDEESGERTRNKTIVILSKHCSDERPWRLRNHVIRGLCQGNDPNIVCSSGGWTPESPTLKLAVLKELYDELVANLQEGEQMTFFFDDWKDLCTGGLKNWFEDMMDTENRQAGVTFVISTQAWKEPYISTETRGAANSYIIKGQCKCIDKLKLGDWGLKTAKEFKDAWADTCSGNKFKELIVHGGHDERVFCGTNWAYTFSPPANMRTARTPLARLPPPLLRDDLIAYLQHPHGNHPAAIPTPIVPVHPVNAMDVDQAGAGAGAGGAAVAVAQHQGLFVVPPLPFPFTHHLCMCCGSLRCTQQGRGQRLHVDAFVCPQLAGVR